LRDPAGTTERRARLTADSPLSGLPDRAACAPRVPRGVATGTGSAGRTGSAARTPDPFNVGGAVVVAAPVLSEVLIAGTVGGRAGKQHRKQPEGSPTPRARPQRAHVVKS